MLLQLLRSPPNALQHYPVGEHLLDLIVAIGARSTAMPFTAASIPLPTVVSLPRLFIKQYTKTPKVIVILL